MYLLPHVPSFPFSQFTDTVEMMCGYEQHSTVCLMLPDCPKERKEPDRGHPGFFRTGSSSLLQVRKQGLIFEQTVSLQLCLPYALQVQLFIFSFEKATLEQNGYDHNQDQEASDTAAND